MIIFEFKEKVLPKKNIREEEEKIVKEVFNMIQKEHSEIAEEIVEIHRLGKYEGEIRPLKVKFRSQTTAQDILSKAWKLANRYKKIWLRKDMTEEERARFNVLIKEVKGKKRNENGRRETESLLESFRPKSEKVVHTRERVRKDSSKEKKKNSLFHTQR